MSSPSEPDVVPDGFVVTPQAVMSLFAGTGMLEEMNRRIQAAGGYLPETLQDLSESLSELTESAPLPDRLVEEFLCRAGGAAQKCPGEMRSRFSGRCGPAWMIARRHAGPDPGCWSGADLPCMSDMISWLPATLARKQQAQGPWFTMRAA